MGGYGSGRSGARPAVEDGITIDLPMMMQRGWVCNGGAKYRGSLNWTTNGQERATVSYGYSMVDPEAAYIELRYTRSPHGREPEKVVQRITPVATVPHYGEATAMHARGAVALINACRSVSPGVCRGARWVCRFKVSTPTHAQPC